MGRPNASNVKSRVAQIIRQHRRLGRLPDGVMASALQATPYTTSTMWSRSTSACSTPRTGWSSTSSSGPPPCPLFLLLALAQRIACHAPHRRCSLPSGASRAESAARGNTACWLQVQSDCRSACDDRHQGRALSGYDFLATQRRAESFRCAQGGESARRPDTSCRYNKCSQSA